MASANGEGKMKGKPRLRGQLRASAGVDHTQLLQDQARSVLARMDGVEGLCEVNPSMKPAQMYRTACLAVPYAE